MNKIGSSETLRETTLYFIDSSSQTFFGSVIDVKENIVSHKSFIKTSFLEWFIGFSEGDGSFIVSKKRLFFIINQKEEKVLHYIRANLGFGKVSKYGHYSRYVVANRSSVDRLISIFNGNLVLNKTNARFILWLQARNQYSLEEICYRGINKFPTFHQNGWLSGFTDAEGCFNAQKLKDPRYTLCFRIRCRFILDQKDEHSFFEKVRSFLESGSITTRKLSSTIRSQRSQIGDLMLTDKSQICNRRSVCKVKDPETMSDVGLQSGDLIPSKECEECQESLGSQKSMYRFTSTHMKSHDILIGYFKKYPLRSIKKVSFIRFTSLCYYIKNRKTLPWQGKVLLRIENLVKNLNTYKS